jgi:tetratricopeptide (TPR) repeat protein
VLAAVGRRDEAIASYERAVAGAPGMVEAREDLALLLVKAGRPADAEAQAREALRLAPASLLGRLQLGAALTAQGGRARPSLPTRSHPRGSPIDRRVHRARGRPCGRGDFERAVTAAERAGSLAEGTAAVAEIERRIASYRAKRR